MYKAPFNFLIPWILSQFFMKIVNKVEVVIEMRKKNTFKNNVFLSCKLRPQNYFTGEPNDHSNNEDCAESRSVTDKKNPFTSVLDMKQFSFCSLKNKSCL